MTIRKRVTHYLTLNLHLYCHQESETFDNINVNLRLSNGLPLSYGHRIQLIGSKAIAEINWAFPF